MTAEPEPILLYDGDCALCQRCVRFVLKHEKQPLIRFAPLQSETGRNLLSDHNLPADLNSFVLIDRERAWIESSAVFALCRHLKAPWSWFAPLGQLPQMFHRPLYRLIARNRRKWFGTNQNCPVPDPEQRERFLNHSG